MAAIVAKLHVSSPYDLNKYLKLKCVKKFLANWIVPTKNKF